SLLFFISPLLLIVLIMYIGCLCKLIIWIKSKNILKLMLFTSFVLYFLILPGPITMPRYHLPALIMMTIMAGDFYSNFFLHFLT
ncbi:hypothetical protein BVX93_02045, partial [bacterium B13(2017)]